MLEGSAVGGPRDGVKLSAGPGWNGKIKRKSIGSNEPEPTKQEAFYPGYYQWDPHYGWVWIPD
jgi:hypothetical protein